MIRLLRRHRNTVTPAEFTARELSPPDEWEVDLLLHNRPDLRPAINRAKMHGCLKRDDLFAALQVCVDCSPVRP